MNNEQEVSTNLTIADLRILTSLIEACTHRGVFKAQELTIIGTVYDKIVQIIKSVADEDSRDQKS